MAKENYMIGLTDAQTDTAGNTTYAETVRWQYVRFHIRQFKGQWKIHGKQKETHNQRNETEVG